MAFRLAQSRRPWCAKWAYKMDAHASARQILASQCQKDLLNKRLFIGFLNLQIAGKADFFHFHAAQLQGSCRNRIPLKPCRLVKTHRPGVLCQNPQATTAISLFTQGGLSRPPQLTPHTCRPDSRRCIQGPDFGIPLDCIRITTWISATPGHLQALHDEFASLPPFQSEPPVRHPFVLYDEGAHHSVYF